MARTYKRDSRGRFAGGGGGGGSSRAKPVTLTRRKPVSQGGSKSRGHLLKRQAVKDAKAKLAAKDPADRTIKGTLSRRAQKGAVTRAVRELQAAQQGGRVRLQRKGGVLRPGSRKAPNGKIDAGKAAARTSDLRARAARLEQQGNALMSGGRRDGAAVNVSLSSRARRNETSAGFRGLEMSRQAAALRNKADRIEQRAAQSAAKAAREAAKPKRTRTPESLRMSRAKQIEKRRGTSMNPAGWRADAAGRMAANAARTQQRAMAFYKSGGKKKAATTVKPVPKLTRDQRIQANEARGSDVKKASSSLRAKLPKKMRDAYKVSTIGGLLLKYASKGSINSNQYSTLSDLIGRGGIKGLRMTMNPNRSIDVSMTPLAKAQARIGEKVGSRAPRRRRR